MLTNFVNTNNNEAIVYTFTDEPVMPVRLYYRINNEELLIRSLKKLKCIWFESNKNFLLSYYKEAKNMNLEVSYQDVPERLYPLVLASGYVRQGGILHLDLDSLQRAVCVIDFLGKHIPSTIMEITSFAHSNRLTVAPEGEYREELDLDFDQIFRDDNILEVSHVIKLDGNEGEVLTDSIDEVLEMLIPYTEENLANYPEVERVSINYNKKRHNSLIAWLSMKALIKEVMAMAHYRGESNYSTMDVIKEIFLMLNNDLEPEYN